jgi:flagellar basal-body rod modification protein FlgD
VAQLQHQDPTQPAQGTEFVTQLAQFAQLQQSVNQTSELTSMTAQMTGLSNNQTTDLVGQSVTMGGGTVSFDGSTATPSNVTLAAAAAQVTATITDSSGNTITTLNLGAEPAGPLNIQWNGQTQAGAAAPAGSYNISVAAADSTGASIAVSQSVTGVVTSVSFNQGYPMLNLSTGASAPISQLVTVGGTSTGSQ